MKVGITGASGFIGYHTYHTLRLTTDWDVIALDREFWTDSRIKECDWVIHLAGKNRGSIQDIYKTNVDLAQQLKDSISDTCKVLFASSVKVDNFVLESPAQYLKTPMEAYSASKSVAEQILAGHLALRIPNVFGPFCKPNYNSFVATFADKICTEEEPEIQENSYVDLIPVNDVVDAFKTNIYLNGRGADIYFATQEWTVSSIRDLFTKYYEVYVIENKLPELKDYFEEELFNTFRSYIPKSKRVFDTVPHIDDRGDLREVITTGEMSGKMFTSTTNPGYTRGGHFHRNKIERFCVVSGDAEINMRKIGSSEIDTYNVSGDNIQVIDMPVYYTHEIKNVGDTPLTTIFWSSLDDTDNYWEAV